MEAGTIDVAVVSAIRPYCLGQELIVSQTRHPLAFSLQELALPE
jgi:hypothetical protein